MKSEQKCLEIALLKEKKRLHATHTEQTITTQHDPPTEGAGADVVRGWWVGVGGWVVVVVVVVVWWCGGVVVVVVVVLGDLVRRSAWGPGEQE